ncbi:MAG: hypothetical protein H6745_20670 [Deltaproteobacteria bacterium]|nr:hypothetical protein [Deltaproteobacteria bacterium]
MAGDLDDGDELVRAKVFADLELRDLGGEPIVGRLLQVLSGGPGDCWAHAQVSAAVWADIERRELLNLHAEPERARMAGVFEDGAPVSLTLRLRDAIAAEVAGDDHAAMVAAVVAALTTPAADTTLARRLRATEAWVLGEATQLVPMPDDPEARAEIGVRVGPLAVDDESEAEAAPSGAGVALTAWVQAWAEERGYLGDPPDEDGFIKIAVPVAEDLFAHSLFALLVILDEDAGWAAAYGVLPANIPEGRRAEVALKLVGLNYELPFGGFEMDPEDGEVRFRTCAAAGPRALTTTALQFMLDMNVEQLRTHGADILELAFT